MYAYMTFCRLQRKYALYSITTDWTQVGNYVRCYFQDHFAHGGAFPVLPVLNGRAWGRDGRDNGLSMGMERLLPAFRQWNGGHVVARFRPLPDARDAGLSSGLINPVMEDTTAGRPCRERVDRTYATFRCHKLPPARKCLEYRSKGFYISGMKTNHV